MRLKDMKKCFIVGFIGQKNKNNIHNQQVQIKEVENKKEEKEKIINDLIIREEAMLEIIMFKIMSSRLSNQAENTQTNLKYESLFNYRIIKQKFKIGYK